jgi:hypothetical protein
MRALGQNAFDHAELLTVLPQVWQSGPKMQFSFGHTLFESGQLSLDERGVGAKRGQFRRVALIQNMREGSLFTRPGEEIAPCQSFFGIRQGVPFENFEHVEATADESTAVTRSARFRTLIITGLYESDRSTLPSSPPRKRGRTACQPAPLTLDGL